MEIRHPERVFCGQKKYRQLTVDINKSDKKMLLSVLPNKAALSNEVIIASIEVYALYSKKGKTTQIIRCNGALKAFCFDISKLKTGKYLIVVRDDCGNDYYADFRKE